MKNIHFNEKQILVDQRDLMNFTSSIFNHDKISKAPQIFVNIGKIELDENPNMVNVTIKFQTFKVVKGKHIGTSYEWKSFRAKCFSCSNTYIKEI
jgi:hypothetical protein